jgi:hypothetical protein
MRHIDEGGEPKDPKAAGMNINPLEFIAVIINLWLSLKLIAASPHVPTGYIITLLSDNTSAIAWMRIAGRVRNPGIRHLARLASAFLVQSCALTTLFQMQHIPGKENNEADCLSRLLNGSVPSWDYVTTQCSGLQTCQICLLPHELLFEIAEIFLSPLTEVTYEEKTIQLLTLELDILPLGSRPPGLQSTISA